MPARPLADPLRQGRRSVSHSALRSASSTTPTLRATAGRTVGIAREPETRLRGRSVRRPLNLIRVMPAKGVDLIATSTTMTSYDVVVVGGGVIGLARRLAAQPAGRAGRGRRSRTRRRAASHAAAGMLAPVTEVTYGEERAARARHRVARALPGVRRGARGGHRSHVGLRTEGTLLVATDAGDRAMLDRAARLPDARWASTQMLTSRECRALEPGLSPDIRCGLLAAQRPLGRQPSPRRGTCSRHSKPPRRSGARRSRSSIS